MVTLSDDESLAALYTTPGSSATSPVKFREPDGRFSISPVDTLPPTCAEVRSTCGDSAVTVTLSSIRPTRRVRST